MSHFKQCGAGAREPKDGQRRRLRFQKKDAIRLQQQIGVNDVAVAPDAILGRECGREQEPRAHVWARSLKRVPVVHKLTRASFFMPA
ncbi:unnamed protein product [Haemonchus placei]|uniref:IBB domain-containing protein n=1 Tax=Haemonchus placei TaxID=6290 RepID=A0A0N4W4W7_HAEPC|nr:unnamed protein product [Haemonchus placei]